MAEDTVETGSIELATEITIAWLSNPNTRANPDDVPSFLKAMHAAVEGLSVPSPASEQSAGKDEHVAAVTARKSLSSREHIISMIDGKPYKSLRRHLGSHGLTPEQYRQRYGLRPDYPMVAPAYAEQRREMAKKIGLGRKAKQPSGDEVQEPTAPARTRRSAKK